MPIAPAATDKVLVEQREQVTVIMINRPQARNAIDRETANGLADAVRAFDADPDAAVAVITGAGGNFCAGLDLKALASGDAERMNRYALDGDAPTGPVRIQVSKPTIAAVEGFALAGGFELACYADLRVVSPETTFGIYCRRWGVPLTDGGTVRLPRIVGQGRAMDLILTGRPVLGEEAMQIGLANRIVEPGTVLDTAVALGQEIARFPRSAVLYDRQSALDCWSLDVDAALKREFNAAEVFHTGEVQAGAARFASGLGRHGDFEQI
jgi:enoyl-CoA hydratase/carnithine racemase